MKRRKIFKIIYVLLATLFVASALITTAMILSFDKQYACPKFGNYLLISVNDSELSPKVLKGSALVSDIKYEEVKNGDYVIIAVKNSSGIQYAARQVERVDDEYYAVSGTEGRGVFYVDKNSVIALSRLPIIGLGAHINMMRTQSGFFTFVIIPLIIVIVIQIIRMVMLIQEKKIKEKYETEIMNNKDIAKKEEISVE
ncbi:MAG: hypothetical protein WC332_05150 [Clostridia bacterium]|jgi:hypothetical protein